MRWEDGRRMIAWLTVGVSLVAIAWTGRVLSSSNDPRPGGITNFDDWVIRLMLWPYLGIGLLAVAWRRSWFGSSMLLVATILAAAFSLFVCHEMLGSSIEAIREGTTPPNLDLAPVGLLVWHLWAGFVVAFLLVGTALVMLAKKLIMPSGAKPHRSGQDDWDEIV